MSRPSTSTSDGRIADLFVRLAQGGLFDRLAGIETPAWQRHLPGVVAQVRSAHRQGQMPAIVVWVEQEKRRRRAQGVRRPVADSDPRRGRGDIRSCASRPGNGDPSRRRKAPGKESSFTLLSSRFSVLVGLDAGNRRPGRRRPTSRDQIDHPGPLTGRLYGSTMGLRRHLLNRRTFISDRRSRRRRRRGVARLVIVLGRAVSSPTLRGDRTRHSPCPAQAGAGHVVRQRGDARLARARNGTD